MTNEEYVGYRSNSEKPQEIEQGFVRVFAERKHEVVALGQYGGDAYPYTYEGDFKPIEEKKTKKIGKKGTEKKEINFKCGFIIAADGVGQGSYEHEFLQKKLDDAYKNEYGNLETTFGENNKTRTKLTIFLKDLYGDDFFKDSDAVNYAVQSFSDVPQNGFFAANRTDWDKKDGMKGQKVLPFYKRDSQSLGSRIVCVGLFCKFRKWVEENRIEQWTTEKAKELRDEIEKYLSIELSGKVSKLFNESDAPDIIKKNVYFLCSTVAMWFYVANPETNTVSALALNCGDARCYTADLKDGVRQISIEDAFGDGRMSAFVHFGKEPRNDKGYHDGQFHARIVELDYPCALFACSDGIYDTCPTKKEKNKVSLPYSEANDSNDFLFEVNLLDSLRRCYSIEDFRREIVFNFYTQCNTQCGESNNAGSFETIKRDDSGTLAGKFFGEKSCLELFVKLREDKNEKIVSDCSPKEDTTDNQAPAVASEENATNVGEENIAKEEEQVSDSLQTEVVAENQDPAVVSDESAPNAGEEKSAKEENISDAPQIEATAENQAPAVASEESSAGTQEKASEATPIVEAPKYLVGEEYKTTLDKLFSHLLNEYKKGNTIPYYPPHVVSSDDKYEETLREYATGKFKNAILDTLISKYPSVYSEMEKHNQKSMWGIENAPLCKGFKLKTTLSIIVNLVAMLKKAIAVYNEVKSMDKIVEQYKNESWDNVLAIPEVAERLKEIDFEGFVEQINNSDNKTAADEMLGKYKQFTAWFFGDDLPNPDDYHVIGAGECKRVPIK